MNKREALTVEAEIVEPGAAANSPVPRIRERAQIQKLAYSIPEAIRATPFSRTHIYALMNSGRLRYVQVKGRRIIPARALMELVGEG